MHVKHAKIAQLHSCKMFFLQLKPTFFPNACKISIAIISKKIPYTSIELHKLNYKSRYSQLLMLRYKLKKPIPHYSIPEKI